MRLKTELHEIFVIGEDPIPPEIQEDVDADLLRKFKIQKRLAFIHGLRAAQEYMRTENRALASNENSGLLYELQQRLTKAEERTLDKQVNLQIQIQRDYAAGKWQAPSSFASATIVRNGRLEIDPTKIYAVRKLK